VVNARHARNQRLQSTSSRRLSIISKARLGDHLDPLDPGSRAQLARLWKPTLTDGNF
jgi:hypothetical protein